jgi:hypothetical protein
MPKTPALDAFGDRPTESAWTPGVACMGIEIRAARKFNAAMKVKRSGFMRAPWAFRRSGMQFSAEITIVQ